MSKKDSIITSSISRRTFTKVMGAAGAAASLGTTGSLFVGLEKAAALPTTIFNSCHYGCETVCEYKAVVDVNTGRYEMFGRAEGMQAGLWGDGKGRMCVKGYMGPERVFNPDRVLYPMKRTNPKKGPNEDPGFVKITWDEAFDLIATNLNETIRTLGPKGVAFLIRPKNLFVPRLRDAIGVANQGTHMEQCFRSHVFAWGNMVYGDKKTNNYTSDNVNSTYILSFGMDQFSKARNVSIQGKLRAMENGAKVTVFDPRFTTFAAKAKAYGGRWYPIKPGTDLAVMWAIMKYVIGNGTHVSEGGTGYWDKDGVAASCDMTTFALLVPHVVANSFATIPGGSGNGSAADIQAVAEWAAGISEVPAADILAVAAEFCNNGDYTTHRPSVPTMKRDGAGGPNYANSWRSAMMEIMLSAVVGSVDRKGGQIPDRRFEFITLDMAWPAGNPLAGATSVKKDTSRRLDMGQMWKLIPAPTGGFHVFAQAAVADSRPYDIGFIFTSQYNLPMIMPDTAVVNEMHRRAFVVNHAFWADEGAWMADVVLPDSGSHEKGGFMAESTQGNMLYKSIALKQAFTGTVKLGDYRTLDAVCVGMAKAADKVTNAGGYAQACIDHHTDYSAKKLPDYPGGLKAVPMDPAKPYEPNTNAFLDGRDSLYKYFTTDGTTTGTALTGAMLMNAQFASLYGDGRPHSDISSAVAGFVAGHGDPEWPYPTYQTFMAAQKAGATSDPYQSEEPFGVGVYPARHEDYVDRYPDYNHFVEFPSHRVKLKLAGLQVATNIPQPNPTSPVPPSASGFPDWSPRTNAPAGSQLNLIYGPPPNQIRSHTQPDALFNEISGGPGFVMHRAAASARGIADGDTLVITAARNGASVEVKVHLTDHGREDVVRILHGWGRFGISKAPNVDKDGNLTKRGFGIGEAVKWGGPNDDYLVAQTTYAEATALLDPSYSGASFEHPVTVTKKA